MQIYNSLTRTKEEFKPRVANKVDLYVCGMTVYDYCHLGHARVLVVFDMVARYLRHMNYDVVYVRNITDIDDKIIARAADVGEDFKTLTNRYIQAMHEDEAMLGIARPTLEPRATDYIDEIIKMVTQLFDNGYAYQGDNGDVYYRVRKFSKYGQLSGQSVDDLRSGERIAPDEAKHDPLDFVLWKSAKPGEPYWASPWGDGRPGWHIECSAMASNCLGNTFDIHAGGMDLKFPHHESEIAQSEAASGETFVNLWMHNGFVQIDQTKMSKSLGNFFTIREILATESSQARMGEIIRYMILASHYRSPLNYCEQTLDNARSALTRFYLLKAKLAELGEGLATPPGDDYQIRFNKAMQDDFNTPGALAVLFDLVRDINKAIDDQRSAQARGLGKVLQSLTSILGIVYLDCSEFLGVMCQSDSSEDSSHISKLVEVRRVAKQNKNWSQADAIRDQLMQQGVTIEDRPDGTTQWRKT